MAEVQNPTQAVKSATNAVIPLTYNPRGKELCRPLAFLHAIFIGYPQQNPNIKVDI
jgi:hypothetical protein